MRQALSIALLLTSGCTEFSVTIQKPDEVELLPVIKIEPAFATFGELSSEEDAQARFTITNTGFAPLNLSGLDLLGSSSFGLLSAPDLPAALERDETASFEVIFRPREGGLLNAEVLVLSDAVNEPELVVPISGEGAIADLVVTPNPVDFGDNYIPCEASRQIVMENVGTEPLEVTEFTLLGEVSQYSVQGLPPLPFTINPNQQLGALIRFEPRLRGDALASIEIASNDLGGVTTVELEAFALYGAEYTDQFVVPEQFPVNILFAVDQSGSMSGEAVMLANQFSSFIQTLSAATQDWKIGVVTLDAGCFNSGVLTAQTPNVAGLFTTAVQQGSDSALTESLLELTRVALGHDRPGGCNAGFRDAGAPLHLIMVSDERDQSPQSWSTYYSNFSAYAGDPALLTVHAIVDVNTSCGGTGASDAGPGGYYEIAATTGGQVLNICNANWAPQLSGIAQQAVANIGFYELGRSGIDEASIEVLVDGQPMSTGWHYDAGRNAIVMDVELNPYQVIDVNYGVSPVCP